MGHIRTHLKQAKAESEFDRAISEELLSAWHELSDLLNGGLTFSNNVNCQIKTVTDTGAANVEFTVAHTLKKAPTGYIVVKADKACSVYDGATTWTTTAIYLKCDIANCNIKLIIF